MPKGARLVLDRKKLIAIAHDIESRKTRLEHYKNLLWPRFLLTFRPMPTTTSKWR
jgi:hypothetical protein